MHLLVWLLRGLAAPSGCACSVVSVHQLASTTRLHTATKAAQGGFLHITFCFPNPTQGQRLNNDMISSETSISVFIVVWFSWCWWPGSLVGGGCPPVLPRHQEAPARPPHSWQSAPAARQPPPPCHLSPRHCRPKKPMKLQIQPGHENFDKMHGKRNDTILLSGCFYQYFR